MMDVVWMHVGSLVIGLAFSLFGAAMMTELAYTGCNGAWMARRKTFKLSAVGFFLFYLLLHLFMFSWR